MSDTDFTMYDTDDEESPRSKTDNPISVNRLPLTTELKIADKTVNIINPDYVMSLQRKLTHLDSRVKFLESEVKSLRSNQRLQESIRNLNYRSESDYE